MSHSIQARTGAWRHAAFIHAAHLRPWMRLAGWSERQTLWWWDTLPFEGKYGRTFSIHALIYAAQQRVRHLVHPKRGSDGYLFSYTCVVIEEVMTGKLWNTCCEQNGIYEALNPDNTLGNRQPFSSTYQVIYPNHQSPNLLFIVQSSERIARPLPPFPQTESPSVSVTGSLRLETKSLPRAYSLRSPLNSSSLAPPGVEKRAEIAGKALTASDP